MKMNNALMKNMLRIEKSPVRIGFVIDTLQSFRRIASSVMFWLGVMTSFGTFNIIAVYPKDPTGTIPIQSGDPEANNKQTTMDI